MAKFTVVGECIQAPSFMYIALNMFTLVLPTSSSFAVFLYSFVSITIRGQNNLAAHYARESTSKIHYMHIPVACLLASTYLAWGVYLSFSQHGVITKALSVLLTYSVKELQRHILLLYTLFTLIHMIFNQSTFTDTKLSVYS